MIRREHRNRSINFFQPMLSLAYLSAHGSCSIRWCCCRRAMCFYGTALVSSTLQKLPDVCYVRHMQAAFRAQHTKAAVTSNNTFAFRGHFEQEIYLFWHEMWCHTGRSKRRRSRSRSLRVGARLSGSARLRAGGRLSGRPSEWEVV